MENKLKRANKVIVNVVRMVIILLIILMLFKRNYEYVGILILTMALTFYEIVLKKIFRIELSDKLKISLTLFIFGAQVLGTVLEFYHKFLWWDTMLHFVSGIIFYFVGETIIKVLNTKTTNVNISIAVIIVFAMCFSLATGVVWEIFEFTVDTCLGQNMQITEGLYGREAIMDTMVDLISLTLGTILIGVIDTCVERKNNGSKSRNGKTREL